MEPTKFWLWKNFVDGRPEYWAFTNPYPCHANGDPMVLGEPCGFASLKDSKLSDNHRDWDEADVLRRIARSTAN